MKHKEKNKVLKSKRNTTSIVLYIFATVVALIAIALLINNIILFKSTASGYVAQGYAANDVLKQLIPSQLVPGIFEPIAVYGGIAFALFGIGIINKKVSKCLALLTKAENCDDEAEENALKESACIEDLESQKQTETIEEIDKNELMK